MGEYIPMKGPLPVDRLTKAHMNFDEWCAHSGCAALLIKEKPFGAKAIAHAAWNVATAQINKRERQTMDDNTMWAVRIVGSDDLHAAPDRAVADALCLVLNRQFERHPSLQATDAIPFRAEVVEWPHGYEAWSAEKDQLRLEVL